MPNLPTGWDCPLSRLFDFFERLPRVLKPNGSKRYRGQGIGFEFHLSAHAGRLELHVLETGATAAEVFIADARQISAGSALRPFIELEKRLADPARVDVDIADILQELPSIRRIFALQPGNERAVLTGSQRRQLAYLWDRAGLDATDVLKLDAPFEIESDADGEVLWRGTRLPLALSDLRPTLGILEVNGSTIFFVQPIEREGLAIAALDDLEGQSQTTVSSQAELDEFADGLRRLAAKRQMQH